MTNFPEWLNAVAATLAAIFSFLAWRAATRAPDPEVVLSSAQMVRKEGQEPYVEVRLTIRNLTEKTLYVRHVSFTRTRGSFEVAQDHEQNAFGEPETPKGFRGKSLENVDWMIAQPAGTPRSLAGGASDKVWLDVQLRFSGELPKQIAGEIAYSYGSPSGRKLRQRTNEQRLDDHEGAD